MGVVDIARIPKAWPPRFDFGEEGRPSHDFSYFFHTFLPRVFHRRLFKVLRKKNEIHCTKLEAQKIEEPGGLEERPSYHMHLTLHLWVGAKTFF